METLIEASHVSLRFSAPTDKKGSLKKWVLDAIRGHVRHKGFLAVDDVSFSIQRGESVGLVGRNGAGKSTLLKLVTGIANPTSGSIAVRGQVAPLLALGNGLDPTLTGRENIYLNGAILGYEKAWLKAHEADIIDFSELGDFINAPVRTYSSGMTMRLAFSIAAAATPEILILDEVLAVGDAAFQAKCRARISTIVKAGATVFFVSHSLEDIRQLCSRAIWLEKGRVVMDGPAAEVCPKFGEFSTAPFLSLSKKRHQEQDDGTLLVARFRSRSLGSQLLTSEREEMQNIFYNLSDWACDGIVFRAFRTSIPGTVPLMRFLSLTDGVHAFAAGESEAAAFRERPADWEYEKVIGYVRPEAAPGLVPVHRLANPKRPGFLLAVGDEERDAFLAANPAIAPFGKPFYVHP
jgi:ABC-type polysaccharide/polyol phosphate transport system ATPase subunit